MRSSYSDRLGLPPLAEDRRWFQTFPIDCFYGLAPFSGGPGDDLRSTIVTDFLALKFLFLAYGLPDAIFGQMLRLGLEDSVPSCRNPQSLFLGARFC